MIFSGQEMGWRDQPISVLQQESLDQFYTPETGDVTAAYVDDAFLGIGTQNADNLRNQVIEFEKNGTPLTEEAYKNSDYYRSTIPYYKDITAESAQLLSEYEDEQAARAFTISKATTAQDIVGFTAAFAAGTVEPKNLIFGAATAGLGVGVLSLRRLVKMRQALGRYGSMAAIGTTEGFVSALAAEPSNRYSAKILRQDYTMADSAWNVATSAVLGAGLSTAPTFIKDRFKKRKFNRAFDDYIDEVETSITQLAQGQKIDIAAVEKINDGVIAKKPIAEKAAMVEAFVRDSEIPLIPKTVGFGLATVKTTPIETALYRQTRLKFDGQEGDLLSILRANREGKSSSIFVTDNQDLAIGQGDNQGVFVKFKANYVSATENEKPAILNGKEYKSNYIAKNSIEEIVIDNNKFNEERAKDSMVARANIQELDKILNNDFYLAESTSLTSTYRPLRNDIDTIARQMDNQNLEVAKQAAIAANDPANSSAIDFEAARAVEDYDADLDQMIAYEEEITALREQGLLSEADEMALAGIDEFNLDDAASAYQAAYFCLTRG